MVALGELEGERDGEDGDHAERRLEKKYPTPAHVVCENAAERCSGASSRCEDDVDISLPLAALAEGDDVAHHD